MTEDYKPRPTHHKWIVAGLIGIALAFWPLMISIAIMDELGWWDEMNDWLLALAFGSFGGAIMRHANV